MLQTIRKRVKRWLERSGFNIVTQFDLSMSALDIGVETVTRNQVPGDYLEFGVFKGASFARVFGQFKKANDTKERTFYAFDSFQGLPYSNEAAKPAQYKTGAYSASEEVFLENLARASVDRDAVRTVAGFYHQTLTNKTKRDLGLKQAALVYIDCDLKESAEFVFAFLTDLIDTGSVIVIDDWFRHGGVPSRGIQKACFDWLRENPDIRLYTLHQWRRIAFIVDREPNLSLEWERVVRAP